MQEREIFAKALDIVDSEERNLFLLSACGSDRELWQHIRELLISQANLGSFLDQPAVAPSEAFLEFGFDDYLGKKIGPYKLLEPIGEGGMGIVYMALQEEPVRRKVALKIVKPGLDSRQILARFEAERQALAMMDHPNIARVYDAGMTPAAAGDEGRVANDEAEGAFRVAPGEREPISPPAGSVAPLAIRHYFVMELVYGLPITQFCDKRKLAARQRLQLFVPVCQAIHHAHQKGVIHRDIKPSNVLVTMYDDKPMPKVIDFGVAKATEQSLTDRTLFTHYGALIGTFEYMSPEQAELNGLGVDTRSDIYSLGVVLYELLTGLTPIDRKRLRDVPLDEAMRRIREEDPLPPSVRMTRDWDVWQTGIGRDADPVRLSRLFRGEIDWIVMKCLEKDRSRRYDTASALARDLERYLLGEPIEACPPSRIYRLRKYAQRHWLAIATLVSFAVLLLVGTAFSTWQALRATRAEREAGAARDSAAVYRDLLLNDPKVRGLPMDHPDRATAQILLGKVLLDIDRPAEAEPILRECLTIREKRFPTDWRTYNACSLLGVSLLNQRKYAEAETLLLRGYNGLAHTTDMIPSSSLVHSRQLVEWLVRLYEKWNKPEQAALWRERLESSRNKHSKSV